MYPDFSFWYIENHAGMGVGSGVGVGAAVGGTGVAAGGAGVTAGGAEVAAGAPTQPGAAEPMSLLSSAVAAFGNSFFRTPFIAANKPLNCTGPASLLLRTVS